MNYDLSPLVTRLTAFTNDGGALASVDVNFGPIMIRAKLYQTQTGYFLSWPSRKNDASEKWYEQVTIADPALRIKARDVVVRQYQKMSQGELVAV